MKIRRKWSRRIAQMSRWMPAMMRDQFGEELEGVMDEHLQDAAEKGWKPWGSVVMRELFSLPGLHARSSGNPHTAQGSEIPRQVEVRPPTPWGLAMLGLLPFLVGGLGWALFTVTMRIYATQNTPPLNENPQFVSMVASLAFFTLLFIFCAAIITAWWQAFPAWAYTLILLFGMFSLYAISVSMPGLRLFGYEFGRQVLGLRALIPLGVVIAISLLTTLPNPARPLRLGLHALSQDLSRLSFGLYGLTPFFVRVIFDEVHGEDAFVIGIDLLMGLCALIYLRARRTATGVLAMLAGLLIGWTASAVYLGIYWEGRQEDWMPTPASGMENAVNTLAFASFIIFFTVLPWLIQRSRRQAPV